MEAAPDSADATDDAVNSVASFASAFQHAVMVHEPHTMQRGSTRKLLSAVSHGSTEDIDGAIAKSEEAREDLMKLQYQVATSQERVGEIDEHGYVALCKVEEAAIAVTAAETLQLLMTATEWNAKLTDLFVGFVPTAVALVSSARHVWDRKDKARAGRPTTSAVRTPATSTSLSQTSTRLRQVLEEFEGFRQEVEAMDRRYQASAAILDDLKDVARPVARARELSIAGNELARVLTAVEPMFPQAAAAGMFSRHITPQGSSRSGLGTSSETAADVPLWKLARHMIEQLQGVCVTGSFASRRAATHLEAHVTSDSALQELLRQRRDIVGRNLQTSEKELEECREVLAKNKRRLKKDDPRGYEEAALALRDASSAAASANAEAEKFDGRSEVTVPQLLHLIRTITRTTAMTVSTRRSVAALMPRSTTLGAVRWAGPAHLVDVERRLNADRVRLEQIRIRTRRGDSETQSITDAAKIAESATIKAVDDAWDAAERVVRATAALRKAYGSQRGGGESDPWARNAELQAQHTRELLALQELVNRASEHEAVLRALLDAAAAQQAKPPGPDTMLSLSEANALARLRVARATLVRYIQRFDYLVATRLDTLHTERVRRVEEAVYNAENNFHRSDQGERAIKSARARRQATFFINQTIQSFVLQVARTVNAVEEVRYYLDRLQGRRSHGRGEHDEFALARKDAFSKNKLSADLRAMLDVS